MSCVNKLNPKMTWVLAPVLWMFTYELWFVIVTLSHVYGIVDAIMSLIFYFQIENLPKEEQLK